MEWITPQHEEIDLHCEVSSYANAELQSESRRPPVRGRRNAECALESSAPQPEAAFPNGIVRVRTVAASEAAASKLVRAPRLRWLSLPARQAGFF